MENKLNINNNHERLRKLEKFQKFLFKLVLKVILGGFASIAFCILMCFILPGSIGVSFDGLIEYITPMTILIGIILFFSLLFVTFKIALLSQDISDSKIIVTNNLADINISKNSIIINGNFFNKNGMAFSTCYKMMAHKKFSSSDEWLSKISRRVRHSTSTSRDFRYKSYFRRNSSSITGSSDNFSDRYTNPCNPYYRTYH